MSRHDGAICGRRPLAPRRGAPSPQSRGAGQAPQSNDSVDGHARLARPLGRQVPSPRLPPTPHLSLLACEARPVAPLTAPLPIQLPTRRGRSTTPKRPGARYTPFYAAWRTSAATAVDSLAGPGSLNAATGAFIPRWRVPRPHPPAARRTFARCRFRTATPRLSHPRWSTASATTAALGFHGCQRGLMHGGEALAIII